jgi:hypothetical protein
VKACSGHQTLSPEPLGVVGTNVDVSGFRTFRGIGPLTALTLLAKRKREDPPGDSEHYQVRSDPDKLMQP